MTSRRHFPSGPLPYLCALVLLAPAGPAAERPRPAAAAAAPGGIEAVHPTDGPDVDIRIYIEEGAVRFRVNANLAFADGLLDMPRELENDLAEVEQEPLVQALFELYSAKNRVTVDGLELDPVLGDWRVIPAHVEDLPLFPLTGARALIRLRLEFEYPLLSTPEHVSMVWGLYPVDTVARLGPNGPPIEVSAQLSAGGYDYPLAFTVNEPEYIWHGELPEEDELFLPVPHSAPEEQAPTIFDLGMFGIAGGFAVAFMGIWGKRRIRLERRGKYNLSGARKARRASLKKTSMIGGGLGVVAISIIGMEGDHQPQPITQEEALAIFEPLHQNIYRAFRFDDESRVYDALARSVDGDLLETLYNQVYRSLVNEAEGGAVSRVEEVRHTEVSIGDIGVLDDEREAFTVDARWQVDGAVIHWGHAHRRTQEYNARYTVARDGEDETVGWRIVGSEILEQRVISATPGLDEEIGESGESDGPADVRSVGREF